MTKQETMKPVLLNKKCIHEIASEIISNLGVKRLVAVWIYKSRVAGTSKNTGDVDIWIQIPEEYAGKTQELQKKLGELRLPQLDYSKPTSKSGWRSPYPLLMFRSEEKHLALNFGDDSWGLPLDIHIGCEVPPKPKKYEGFSPESFMEKLVLMDRKAMDFVKQKFGNETIIGAEVGVWKGDNAVNILENMPNVRLLYLVDPYPDRRPKSKDWRPFKAIAKKKLAPFNSRIRWIHKEFEVCTTKDIPDPLDFIYIDGDHSYEYVKQDIALAVQLVKKGGIIGGHDFGWGRPDGVGRAVEEYCERNNISYSEEGGDWWFINAYSL